MTGYFLIEILGAKQLIRVDGLRDPTHAFDLETRFGREQTFKTCFIAGDDELLVFTSEELETSTDVFRRRPDHEMRTL
ncbi:MAG TPA: hypothetical protein VN788_08810 [Verrucomicrobiae bacterium]|nr:hypothetical protein [Verrucomicrobiae bacterium]